MSAGGNLKGYLREYGYDSLPGLTVIPKRCLLRNLDFYKELAGKERPAVFVREMNSEWLVCMKMSDFMDLYRSWENDTRETRDMPFYGTGATEEE